MNVEPGEARAAEKRSRKWTIPIGVVGAVFVIFQFFAAQYEGRIQRSLDRIKVFNSELKDSAQYIDDFWKQKYENAADVVPIDQLQETAVDVVNDNEKYRNHARTMRIFYHELALCVNVANCDAFTACQYFHGKVTNFMFIHDTYFDEYFDLMIDDGQGKQIKAFEEKTCAPLRHGTWSNPMVRYIDGYFGF